MSAETTRTDCPDMEQLEALVEHSATDLTVTRSPLEAHISICDSCRRQIEQIRENLQLLGPLRAAWNGGARLEVDEPVPEFVGAYRIIRKIGEGGMGRVFLAEQENPRRNVALKMIRAGRTSGVALRRFRHEIELLGRLRHPGIAQIYEGATHETPQGPVPYFTMEPVEGPPLVRYAQVRQSTLRQRLELLAKVCDAVGHAHDQGIVHRDLKPGNILVAESPNGEPQPKILDFGVARALEPQLELSTMQTDDGQLLGTIAYMSPEQVSGRSAEVDRRSDVYALGVIAYELLGERLPYDATNRSLPELVWLIGHDDPAPLSSINRGLRGDVQTIVGKAMEKERARRYATASEMADDIRRYLRDEPIRARPASTAYQLSKFARRNKTLVGGVVVAFAALLAGGALSTWQAVRATQAKRIAVAAADAEKSARQAEAAQRRQAESVATLLESIFRGLDPTVGGEDLRSQLTRKLDEVAATLDTEFAGQPLVRARLRNALGQTFLALAEYEKAELLITRAVEEQSANLPADDARLLESLNGQAELYRLTRRPVQAIEIQERILAIVAQQPEANSAVKFASMSNLAWLFGDIGRFDKAAALFEQVLDEQMQQSGPDHPQTLHAMNSLGAAYLRTGQFARALPLLEQVLQKRQAILPRNHDHTLRSMHDLGSAYANLGRFDEGIPLLEEALTRREQVLGAAHPQTLQTMNDLAVTLLQAHQLERATVLFERSLAAATAKLGPDHQQTLVTMQNLALAYHSSNRWQDALPIYEQVLEKLIGNAGPDHPDALMVRANLANVYIDAGELDRACGLLEESASGFARVLGDDHPDTLNCVDCLAAAVMRKGDLERSVQLASEANSKRRTKLGPQHPATLLSTRNLAWLYQRASRPELAEPLWLELWAIALERHGADHPEAHLVARQLVEVYESMDRPDAVTEWRARVPATQPAG